jgi:hypothetical protein
LPLGFSGTRCGRYGKIPEGAREVSEREVFLDEIFGGISGVVYAPYREATSGAWFKRFYEWPDSIDTAFDDIASAVSYADQYVSPSIYSSMDIKESWFSSSMVWVDFDKGIPEKLYDISPPTLRISSSSNEGKEHWYWKLREPLTDPVVLEYYNKNLAYQFGGDPGCWNRNRVLRIPGTRTFKYKEPRDVCILEHNEGVFFQPENFTFFDYQTNAPVDFTYELLSLDELKSQCSFMWPHYWEVVARDIHEDRSKALSYVALRGYKYGMSDNQVFNVLVHMDNRCKKFVGRPDRSEKLYSLLEYAKAHAELDKKPSAIPECESDESDPLPFGEFVNQRIDIEWIVPGLIHKTGLSIIAAPPSVGKTQFSLSLAMSLGAPKNFINWEINKTEKILFLSLEMGQPELKFYLDQMIKDFDPEQVDGIHKNLYFKYMSSFRLSSERNQELLLKWIDKIQPDGVMIDSLSRCTGGDLEKTEVDTVFDFLNKKVRDKRKKFVWLVHHNRKANYMQKQPKKLSDMYGSQYIGAYASTVLGLWSMGEGQPEVEVNCLKSWFGPPFKSFLVERNENLMFSPVDRLELK